MPFWWISSLAIGATPAPLTSGNTPPLGLSLLLGFTCFVVILVLGVLALGIWLAIRERRTGNHPKDE